MAQSLLHHGQYRQYILTPCERVLLYPERNANPFFHLYESLWMLAGRNDVAGPARYAKNMNNYSDNGVTLPRCLWISLAKGVQCRPTRGHSYTTAKLPGRAPVCSSNVE